MISRSDFAYVQARIQSRHADRPTPLAWERLHGSHDVGHLLEAARASGLGRWVEEVSARTDVHTAERALRRGLREHVAEVASWTPRPWRPAVEWLARLVDLPALERLLGPEPPPPWMAEDPELETFTQDEREARAQAMREAGLGALVDAVDEDEPVRTAWRRRFEELLPTDVGRRSEVVHLVELFERHVERMQSAEADVDGWELRGELTNELEDIFRWNALRPVAVFAHVALVALDLEKLRGAITRRRLFPETRSEVSWV